MILQALAEYYDTLANTGQAPQPGWARNQVSFALSLSESGELLAVSETVQEVQSGKKTAIRPQSMEVPASETRTVAIQPNFLCDNADYLLGLDAKGKPERSRRCFAASAEHHRTLLEPVAHPAARAVCCFFEHWNPEEAETHPKLQPHLEQLKKGGNLVFRVGGSYVHELPPICDRWREYTEDSGTGDEAVCLVSGEMDAPARLHPKIKGVRGAQSVGASLVSFNANAYDSYGKSQGFNAPVGEKAAFAYGAALNALLADTGHCQVVGDMTIVFWAEGGNAKYQDMFSAFMTMDDRIDDIDLKAAMVRLADGRTTQWEEADLSPQTPFYILALSPNAARLSVRFFLRDSFGVFAKRMLDHQKRLEMIAPKSDRRKELGVWALLQETVNQNARDKVPAPGMAGEVMRSILTGGRYPATLLHAVHLRIRSEREVTRGRAAIIKAYYLNNPHPKCPKEVLTVQQNDSTNIPYRLGRAFAIFEAIQQSASPSLNTTLKDKYFSSAAGTPAMIFPTLINMAQKHMRKLEKGLAVHYEKQIVEIMEAIGAEFPARLSLPEQGSFQLGYYHQLQERYRKKEEKQDA